MGESTYAFVTSRMNPIKQNNQDSKYRALVEKLIQLKPKNREKFSEQLKKLHSTELQTQPRAVCTNKEKVTDTTKLKPQTNPIAQTETNPQ